MSLTHADSKPCRKYRIGYKLVLKAFDRYVCDDYPPCAGSVGYPVGKWIIDPQPNPDPKKHPNIGFHIMLDKEIAKSLTYGSHVVIKVKFRKVIASNTIIPDSTYGYTVVAREVYNLGEVK